MGGIGRTERILSSMTTGYIDLLSRRLLRPRPSRRRSQENHTGGGVDLASDIKLLTHPPRTPRSRMKPKRVNKSKLMMGLAG